MTSTTGTSIQGYLAWVEGELEKKSFGEVAIRFIVTAGKVTDVRTESVDKDHFPLGKK
jgi:hypothetical protein